MLTERFCSFVENQLNFLDRSKEVIAWVENNPVKVKQYWAYYGGLIESLDELRRDDRICALIPAVKVINDLVGEREIMTGEDFKGFRGAILVKDGIKTAKGPMRLGQEIAKGIIDDPTDEQSEFAVLTPSKNTTPDALFFGTMGHLVERIFFALAKGEGIEPEGGWKKDTFILALAGVVLSRLAIDEKTALKNPCINFFITPDSEGGLDWIKEMDIVNFKEQLYVMIKNPNK